MTTTRRTATRPVPAGLVASDLGDWLGATCADWGLPPTSGARWVSALSRPLPHEGALELYLEYDPVTELATVELWQEGQVCYGIDDWLGGG